MDAGIIKPGEITHAICLYFVIYYMRDIEAFFRNMFVWVRPGGMMAIEVVNKYKFDPMLESASPFVAFSMQKYAKERIRKSEVNVKLHNFLVSETEAGNISRQGICLK